METHPLEPIRKLDPAYFDRISESRKFAFRDGALPVKVKYLIAMAIDAAHGAPGGVASLARQAVSHGANKREIIEALQVVAYIAGVGSVYTAAAGLVDFADEGPKAV